LIQREICYDNWHEYCLIEECSGRLAYSAQATLLNAPTATYAAAVGVRGVEGCAQMCHRQHYCLSAVYRPTSGDLGDCLMSFEQPDDDDEECREQRAPPAGFDGALFISCIKCL